MLYKAIFITSILIQLLLYGDPVTKMQIFGERNSGTNYLQKLLKLNFPDNKIFVMGEEGSYGFKHWPAWHHCSLELNEKIFPRRASRFYYYPESEDCLFILIVRNPYDWLKSMKKNSYEIKNKDTFLSFITSPVEFCTYHPASKRNMSVELNPETNLCFKNLMELRTTKLKNLLAVEQKVKNSLIIKYEDLVNSPKKFLKLIASFSDPTDQQRTFQGYDNDARSWIKTKRFVRAHYTYSERELKIVNQSLNWETENLFGYKKKLTAAN